MGEYASCGPCNIPALVRPLPKLVLRGVENEDSIGQYVYQQDFQPVIQFGADVAAIHQDRGHQNDWFVVAIGDPSALDVTIYGTKLWIDQLVASGSVIAWRRP